jgi:hypothetical protein
MRINPDALERLKGATFNSEVVAFLLEQVRGQAEIMGAPTASLSLDYEKPGDKVEPGDVIPVLTFTLRPAK